MSNIASKWFRRNIAGTIKDFRRLVRSYFRDPVCALDFCRFRKFLKKREWLGAKDLLYPLAQRAIQGRNYRLISELGFSAERLGDHSYAVTLALESCRILGKDPTMKWSGESLTGKTLAIHFMESEKQGLAHGLAMSGFAAEAASSALHTILVVESRLVGLFRRRLPNLEVIAYPQRPAAKPGSALVEINLLCLKSVLGTTTDQIAGRFLPLIPDAGLVEHFKSSYRSGRKLPLIGISWWSSHFGKDLPSSRLWAQFISRFDGIFVDVQYSPLESDLKLFREAVGSDHFIHDSSVDQLEDMDRFAAQLGSLDALVTISNTGAHLAGAMGIPTVLIRDDWFRRAWPVLSDRTPWYPETRVVGKNGRPWSEVFKDVERDLAKRLGSSH
jgi:hypothetical protein